MYNERDVLIELLGNMVNGVENFGSNATLIPTGNRQWLKWFSLGNDDTAPTRSDTGMNTGQVVNATYAANLSQGHLMVDLQSALVTTTKNANALQYSVTIPFTDTAINTRLNGQTINEIGLWTIANDYHNANFYVTPDGVPPTGNEVLFSRQVHPAIEKTNQIQIEYTYSIYFT